MSLLKTDQDRKWKRIAFYSLFMAFASLVRAQDNYYIRFSDKNNNKYSIDHPEAYLSPRSLHRRQAQHIAIRADDLPLTDSYVNAVTALPVHVVYRLKWDNAILVRSADTSLVAKLLQLPFVKSVNKISGPSPSTVQKKLAVPIRKSLQSASLDTGFYGASANQNTMIQVNQLHQMGYWGDGVLIAVMDAGFINVPINPYFAQMYAQNRVLYTWNYVYDTSFVYGYDLHGAYALSDIAAYNPDSMVGTAPNAQFLLFITEDTRSEKIIEEYNWVNAAEVADSIGADIFSTSLGYTTFDPIDSMYNTTYATLDGHSTPMAIAANAAANKGIIVVNSAGNEGVNTWHYISTPADADSAVAVGAVTPAGAIAAFSGVGPPWMLPVVKPNICTQGNPAAVIYSNGGLGSDNGTSFSCPIAAGAFACLREAFPDVPNMLMIQAVEQSANRYTDPDSSYGYGIPDFGLAYQYLKALYPLDTLINTSNIVYPNPFSDAININTSGLFDTPISVDLYDELGQKVYSRVYPADLYAYNTLSVTIPDLQAGIYILHINGTYTIRMVKEP